MTSKPLPDHAFLQQALATARAAAEAAESVIRSHYLDQALGTEVKADQTPVTVADKAAEQVIRDTITGQFPEHGIYGEEFGRSDQADSDFLWLIDPIDGTKSFVRGYPFFSTQIALMYQQQLVVGVSNAPVFNEMAWATLGGGAFLNGQAILVDPDAAAHSRCVSTGNIQSLIQDNWQRFGALLTKFSKIRGYGDFYHYHLLASGKIDLVVESDVNILDIAALTLIVQEAGGIMTDIQGKPINLQTRSVMAGTQATHALGIHTLNE
ncbi:inositol monophosphatase family protein [Marinicella meishanensis]|uniref:inositol monophosphatase family protein n=1 Tax=Marinicella meishanensis TaxID=2873263 RepID=UPI001CBDCCAB|nr:inositol monophosphatase family protein [Marinicella sp. NBU2979]